jgi:cardiolipin synthase C
VRTGKVQRSYDLLALIPGVRSGLARLALVLCVAQLAACAGTVAPVGPPHQHETHAITDFNTTTLGKVFEAEARQHPGLSGFDLIFSGRTAFEARYVFTHLAQRSIDAQYFIWADDATGRNMLLALLDAADRGVRVRLLLDDFNLDGQDLTLAAVRAHPNIEVRLFNPFESRGSHAIDLLVDFRRLNHRMHDKAFIVDNSVAVIGGRNMSDPYFSADAQANFRDLDLFAAGPVVQAVSQEFDEFWNSAWATSIHRLVAERPTPEQVREMVARLHEQIAATPYPFRTAIDESFLEHFTERVRERLIWGKATLLADRPDKPMTSEPQLAEALRAKVGGTVQKELLLESAYFMPTDSSTAHLCALRQRGVQIRVLTNSLASTDEASVYAGFMRHRADLLRCGVELHELRPDAAFVRREWTWLRGRSEAELHTKAVVFDGMMVMVGSFNLDPRSRNLNTELAVLVESPALAAKVASFIGAGMSPANSFRLELDQDDHVIWVAEDQGRKEVRFRSAPNASLWRRVRADLLSLLPIEGLL